MSTSRGTQQDAVKDLSALLPVLRFLKKKSLIPSADKVPCNRKKRPFVREGSPFGNDLVDYTAAVQQHPCFCADAKRGDLARLCLFY